MVPGLDAEGGMQMLNVVFWDVDGTLADTEMDGHRPAFNRVFQELGLPFHWNREEYARRLEIPGGLRRVQQACQEVGHPISDELLEQLRERKRIHYGERIAAGHVGWRPGVRRLLHALKSAGIASWIVTSSGRASVNALLAASRDEQDWFSGIVTADDVQRGKPAPDLYQLAIKRAAVEPTQALAIEDSLAGLESARAAGLACLLTPSPWETGLPARYGEAVAVLNHLGDPDHCSTVIAGPACTEGVVTVKYLQALLEGG